MNKSDHVASVKALSEALREVFGEHEDTQRFVDVSRIPLICKSIISLDTNITEINRKLDTKFVTNEAFSPVQKIVYGLVGLILTAVAIAVLGLVIMQ